MAIGTIPPWLELPNFIASMREGANVGLSARQEDRQEQGAADRLQLAYESLAAKERMADQAAQARQQQASAALALKAQQQEQMQEYRQQELEMRQKNAEAAANVLAETIKHHRAMEMPKPVVPKVRVKLAADEDNPEMTGDITAPAIQDRLKKKAQSAADALQEYNSTWHLFHPSTWGNKALPAPVTNQSPFKILNIRKKEAPSVAPSDDSEDDTE